ncbi:MAG: phage holin family protein [Fusobacteriaceae bacterium]|nr:phage holin family protein [Fusobacteriaceae bacterium]
MKNIIFNFLIDIKLILIKGGYAIILIFFPTVTNKMAALIGFFVFMDTLTGVIKGWNSRLTSSEKLRKFIKKMITYGCAIMTFEKVQDVLSLLGLPVVYNIKVWGKTLSLSIVFLICLCIIGTEFLSIIENWGEMGLYLPLFLRNHLEKLKFLDMRKK